MLLEPTPDQEFLRETTDKFLGKEATVSELRARRDDPAGFDSVYWRRGAELGWTSLLVGEDHGGGSVSGRGLIDLTLIAYEFGRHGAPGPLLVSNVLAAALTASGGEYAKSPLSEILAGTTVGTWAFEDGPSGAGVSVELDGDDVVLQGLKRPVESAGQSDWLLVTGRTGDGLTQVLVPRDTPGVAISPLRSVDLTRRFAEVAFDQVRLPRSAVVGEIGRADEAVRRQVLLALVLQSAESVGAMDAAFSMTVEWAFDRYSFGRPIASYQALKHRFADMKSWLEGSHAIADAAADAVEASDPSGESLARAAKAYIGHYGAELMQDCVQIHGGIGVTFEHDLHIFLRRVAANRALLGTPADHLRVLGRDALEVPGAGNAGVRSEAGL